MSGCAPWLRKRPVLMAESRHVWLIVASTGISAGKSAVQSESDWRNLQEIFRKSLNDVQLYRMVPDIRFTYSRP